VVALQSRRQKFAPRVLLSFVELRWAPAVAGSPQFPKLVPVLHEEDLLWGEL
jgi:hypothetical protein